MYSLGVRDPSPSCHDTALNWFDLVSLATRIAVIIGDGLVLFVTWSKTAQLYRESRRLGIRAPLATLLFRDGE